MRRFIEDTNIEQSNVTKIYCNNKSIISMTNNSVFNKRTKYIKNTHFVQDQVTKNLIEMKFTQ